VTVLPLRRESSTMPTPPPASESAGRTVRYKVPAEFAYWTAYPAPEASGTARALVTKVKEPARAEGRAAVVLAGVPAVPAERAMVVGTVQVSPEAVPKGHAHEAGDAPAAGTKTRWAPHGPHVREVVLRSCPGGHAEAESRHLKIPGAL
jgi:hypothetical protein